MNKKLAIISIAGLFLLPFTGCSKVDQVKEGKLQINTSTTIGKVFDTSFGSPEWTEGTSEKGQDFVEFKGDVDIDFMKIVAASILSDVSDEASLKKITNCTDREFSSQSIEKMLESSILGQAINSAFDSVAWKYSETNQGTTTISISGKLDSTFMQAFAKAILEKDNGMFKMVGQCTNNQFANNLMKKVMEASMMSFGLAEEEIANAMVEEIASELQKRSNTIQLNLIVDESSTGLALGGYDLEGDKNTKCSLAKFIPADDFMEYVCSALPNASDCNAALFASPSLLGISGMISDENLANILFEPLTQKLYAKSKRLTTQFIFLDEADADFQMGYYGLDGNDWEGCALNEIVTESDYLSFIYSNHSYHK